MTREIGYDTLGHKVFEADRPHLIQLHGVSHPSGKPVFLRAAPAEDGWIVGYQADGTPLFGPVGRGAPAGPAMTR